MFISIFIIVAPFLVFLLVLLKLKYQKRPRPRPPPGPKGLPFIGNLLHYGFSKVPHEYLANLSKVHGPVVGLTLGHVPVVVVQSPEMAKEVLKTQDLNFCSRPSLVGLSKLSYNCLDIAFAPYSEYFKEIKKLSVVHLFSSKRVESFAPIRREEVSRLINNITNYNSNVVNLGDLLMAFATSNICRIAFGKRYEDNEGSRSKFHSLLNEAQALFVVFFFKDYFPYLGWLDTLTGQLSRLERVFNDMDIFYEEIIKDHLDPKRIKPEKDDIIDVLLQLKNQGSFAFEITFDHIKAMLADIFLAGTETSTTMVEWAMTELVRNPSTLKKVQDEIRNVTQNKGYVAEEDLPKLEYFKAVIKETFRLHPAAPLLLVHETIRKTTLNGYDIEPKTLVHVNVWAIGRDPELWKDPEAFMPERFMGSSIDYKGQDFELVPFGAGRRICPGLALGVVNLELALANLLYTFDWELPLGLKREDIDTEVISGISMRKKNPLCLVAKKFPIEFKALK